MNILNIYMIHLINIRFFRYMRMTPNRFEHLFTLVGHRIGKRTTKIWKPISAPQRLALTLRYLATVES